MDFFQSLRATQLTEQLTNLSNPATVSRLYGDLQRRLTPSRTKDNLVIQRWQDGYLTCEEGTLKYEDLNTGKTYVLRKSANNVDHKCYKDLYDFSVESRSFRCNKLEFREVTSAGYEYLEFSPPNGEFGTNAVNNHFFNPVANFNEYATNNIQEIGILMKGARQVAVKNNAGVPDFSLILWDQWEDSKGLFWQEMLDWNLSYAESVGRLLILLENMIDLNRASNKITDQEAATLLELARTTWQ